MGPLSISRFQPACAIKRVSDGSQRQLWRFLRYILGLPGLFTGPLGGGCLADYSDTWPFLRLLWSCKAFRILQYYLTRLLMHSGLISSPSQRPFRRFLRDFCDYVGFLYMLLPVPACSSPEISQQDLPNRCYDFLCMTVAAA